MEEGAVSLFGVEGVGGVRGGVVATSGLHFWLLVRRGKAIYIC